MGGLGWGGGWLKKEKGGGGGGGNKEGGGGGGGGGGVVRNGKWGLRNAKFTHLYCLRGHAKL